MSLIGPTELMHVLEISFTELTKLMVALIICTFVECKNVPQMFREEMPCGQCKKMSRVIVCLGTSNDPMKQLMDEQIFSSEEYQRVYQYLQREEKKQSLYTVHPKNVEGSPKESTQCLMK